jgi:hypothetical protein
MKKTRKKFLLMLIMVFISAVTLMTLQATAVSGETTLDNIEYSSEDIPAEKLEQIVKSMYGISDEKPMEKGNVLCIFGHSKATGTTKTIEHRYYSTAPKCKETFSHIDYCTRSGCDYYVIVGQSINRIVCCP